MTSLVQDFLVNPVVRQARRFSTQRPSATTDAPGTETSACLDGQHQPEHVVVDSESEEHPSSDFEIDQMSSSSPSTASLQNVSMDSPDNARMADAVRALESMTERLSIPDQAPEVAVSPSPRTFKPGRSMLPEDDGMGVMRRRIRAIQAQHVTSSEKAHLMHKLLSEGHQRTQTSARSRSKPYPSSSSAGRRSSRTHDPSESYSTSHDAAAAPEAVDQSHLTDQDLEPTYAPVESHADEDVDSTGVAGNRPFGCEHYRRNIKMQCSTCNRWYTCRFCHNQAEDHELIRHQTRNMLCMFCGVAQKAGESCAACGALAARYYCAICKLWSDDPDKPCYHCHDCGICRIGEGLGKDFVHCKKCCACIAISTQNSHKCVERVTDCDCPICGEYMFTSPKAVCFMVCGHSIHQTCYQDLLKTSYRCPLCSKSLVNMEYAFQGLQSQIESQPMPDEFRHTRALVICNDCSARSTTPYHWLGLKCSVCSSFNTAQIDVIGRDEGELNAQLAEHLRNRDNRARTPANAQATDIVARDIRRRHSSNPLGPGSVDQDWEAEVHRLARSVSPVHTPGQSLHASAMWSSNLENEDDDDPDILGFWSRIPRSLTSNDGDYDEDDDDEDLSDDSNSDEEMEDDHNDEESDDDEFALLGHR